MQRHPQVTVKSGGGNSDKVYEFIDNTVGQFTWSFALGRYELYLVVC